MIVEREIVHPSDIQSKIDDTFNGLCGEYPGASIIRRSNVTFKELRALDHTEAFSGPDGRFDDIGNRSISEGAWRAERTPADRISWDRSGKHEGDLSDMDLDENTSSDPSLSSPRLFEKEASWHGSYLIGIDRPSGVEMEREPGRSQHQISFSATPLRPLPDLAPTGHGFQAQAAEPVGDSPIGLLTGYHWNLRNDYEGAVRRAADAEIGYQMALQSLLRNFPQGEGEVPQRPDPTDMDGLFKKVFHHRQKPPHSKGSKGGVKGWQCEWPGCNFIGPMQKCIDHFFSAHVRLKFFRCDQHPW